TEASVTNPAVPLCRKNCTAYSGLIANTTSGLVTIQRAPRSPSVTNHTIVTGPNMRPIAPVPRRCTTNSVVRMTIAPGSTKCSSRGVATARPSIALSTEIAGVMNPSPKNSAAPKTPTALTGPHTRQLLLALETNVLRASTPPSPRLSARSTIATYLTEMISTSDQRISDRMPRMFCSVNGMPCSGFRHSRNAYSGLVPMSPKTTPSAVRTSLRLASLRLSARAAVGELACMGRALYRTPRIGGYSTTLFDHAGEPARQRAAEAGAKQRHHDQLDLTRIVGTEFGRALHDQRAHQARIVEPPGEGECKRDTRDDAGDDEQQRATPAALQGLQILLQFLLDALTLSGALRIVDSFDLRNS